MPTGPEPDFDEGPSSPPLVVPDWPAHRDQLLSGHIRLADLPQRELPWLWPGRIPIGKVTLLVGDPGVGKSLIALDVAARVTTAQPWPDQGSRHTPCAVTGAEQDVDTQPPDAKENSFVIRHSEIRHSPPSPASVLLLSAEDDLADTIRPRLEALGADCSRITAIPPGWTPLLPQPGAARTFDLRHDLNHLERVLRGQPDCRLVIVDPITAYLGGNIENSNAEIRRLVAPLAELAAARRVAILAISHLRKQSGAALHRTMGSLAFVAAARAAWLVAKDPASPDRRLMLPLKNNLAAGGGSLAFTIEADPGGQPRVCWSSDPTTLTADEALRPVQQPRGRPGDERNDAIAWLRKQLGDGPRPSAEIAEQAVAHGIRLATLRRAFRQLDGQAVKAGWGPLSQWLWSLPGVGAEQTGGILSIFAENRAETAPTPPHEL
jgi:hypothetical protein